MLKEYVGELMIMLFEERRLQLLEDLRREEYALKREAAQRLHLAQKRMMLDLLDTFWAEFLNVSSVIYTLNFFVL